VISNYEERRIIISNLTATISIELSLYGRTVGFEGPGYFPLFTFIEKRSFVSKWGFEYWK